MENDEELQKEQKSQDNKKIKNDEIKENQEKISGILDGDTQVFEFKEIEAALDEAKKIEAKDDETKEDKIKKDEAKKEEPKTNAISVTSSKKQLSNLNNNKNINKKNTTLILLIAIVFLIVCLIVIGIMLLVDKYRENSNGGLFNFKNSTVVSNSVHISTKTSNESVDNKKIDNMQITYTTEIVKEINIGQSKYICREQIPEIKGIDDSVSNKIEDGIKNKYLEVWSEINKQCKDEDVKSILNGKEQYYDSYEIGFKQSCKPAYLSNQIITFNYYLEGGLGGVSWSKRSGITFDLKTGEIINIEDIVLSKDEYIKICKEYVLAELKKDPRYDDVLKSNKDEYELIINSSIEKLEGYFTAEGIVCVEIPKGVIASMASGEFKYTIPYSRIKKCISSEYDFSNINNKAKLIKEVYVDNTKTKGTIEKKK